LVPAYTSEVLAYATELGKPIARVYLSHAHPDHFAGAGLVDAATYALAPVRQRINETGDFMIQGAYQLTPGHDGVEPPSARPVDHTVERGDERIDGVQFSFEPVGGGDTTAQLAIGLPDDGILIARDVVYNHVHAFLAEQTFDAWMEAIDALEALPYTTILPGHGLPGDRTLYAVMRAYLTAARGALAEASGPDDLNRRLEAAYPDYGGTAMQRLQNVYLFPNKP
jgi:glyoxylase-like metal-dependent hydrolase (beta-lactamase superfamily II)